MKCVYLTWEESDENPDGYVVRRKEGDDEPVLIALVFGLNGEHRTSYRDRGVA